MQMARKTLTCEEFCPKMVTAVYCTEMLVLRINKLGGVYTKMSYILKLLSVAMLICVAAPDKLIHVNVHNSGGSRY
jgi:hypothetical protein